MTDKDRRTPRCHLQQHQQPQLSGLARLPSVYSLTFDEFQNAHGGPGRNFGSMNMDELVKSIWTAEEAYTATAPVDFGGSGCSELQRQGSITLPRTMTQKTVDEVWRELFGESGLVAANAQMLSGCGVDLHSQQPETVLGDTTLEEFLVRAGVIIEGYSPPAGPVFTVAGDGDLSSKEAGSRMGLGLRLSRMDDAAAVSQDENSIANSGIAELRPPYPPSIQLGSNNAGYADRTLDIGRTNGGTVTGAVGLGTGVAATRTPDNLVSSDGGQRSRDDLPSTSQAPYAFKTSFGRKRGVLEMVNERRQRRMIKNRESAARSRARKQAYTMELEDEVMKLKERNQELQNKHAEILEWHKNQILLGAFSHEDAKRYYIENSLRAEGKKLCGRIAISTYAAEKILGINSQQTEPNRPHLSRAQTGPW